MPDRLTPLDASFLYMEKPTAAMHVGSVMVFDPGQSGVDIALLASLVSNRVAAVRRYRQKVRDAPAGIGGPVWVDDSHFDVTYHVRRVALPRPGNDEQLEEFVARVQARPLDRTRPLWEVYLVEGLEQGRFAIVTKTHQALVDGVHAPDIGELILTERPSTADTGARDWTVTREPGDLELLAGAVTDVLTSPAALAEAVRGGVDELRITAGKVTSGVGEVVGALARSATRPTPTSPLNGTIGQHRRYVIVGTDLAEYRRVRDEVMALEPDGPDISVNDVVLATITGALRIWSLQRGLPVNRSSSVRALVPVSVYDTESEQRTGNRLMACFVDLPIGEPTARMRLHQVAFSMRSQMEGGRAIGASALSGIAGFASPTLHAMGSRLGSAVARRMFNVVITNVPGPQRVLYAADAPMVSTFPVVPLIDGQTLSIGLTSYAGGVFFGFNGDRERMHDLDVLGAATVEALEELAEPL